MGRQVQGLPLHRHTASYTLNEPLCLHKIHVETLTPNVMALGGEALTSCTCYKRGPRGPLPHMKTQKEDCEPGSWPSPDTGSPGTWISNSPPSRTIKNKSLLLKPPSLVYSYYTIWSEIPQICLPRPRVKSPLQKSTLPLSGHWVVYRQGHRLGHFDKFTNPYQIIFK